MLLSIASGVGLSVLAGAVSIPTAGADADSFLRKLHDAGINTPRGDFELKEWGYEVCSLRTRGKPPRQWVEQTVYNSSRKPQYGLTEQQANIIVDLAVAELCDDRDGPGPHGVF
ncbi:DUF732 domain-containing protein [Mycolicibacterium fortuitum]|uniref:DUF732 domain-containing protein n=1 Tax=Mycolicibacterium fortuitum TaxID=1766 RepID=UPI0013F5F217|nr:DUF732 domain-containing protein [Mycolicibacterium fortuitum]